MTENVWPAIVTEPVRCAPVLAATATLTLPLPVPPALTVSQAALLVELQAQVLAVVTATLVVSPAAGELRRGRRDRVRCTHAGLRHRERLAGDRDRAGALRGGGVGGDGDADACRCRCRCRPR